MAVCYYLILPIFDAENPLVVTHASCAPPPALLPSSPYTGENDKWGKVATPEDASDSTQPEASNRPIMKVLKKDDILNLLFAEQDLHTLTRLRVVSRKARQEINKYWQFITNLGARHINNVFEAMQLILPQCKRLRHLDLSKNRIDQGMAHLTRP